ncbi:MAG: hypothetical protein QNJ05_01380 [Woeseiaceae bacterium]|nr:hypothetical protein [Woeseiaceae bacterium]
MQAFIKQKISEVISFAVMLLMLVAIVHGQVLVRTDSVADVPASNFESVAASSGLER